MQRAFFLMCVLAGGCGVNTSLPQEVDAGLDPVAPNSCTLNVFATRRVTALGARSDTGVFAALWTIIPRDCGGDTWAYNCAFNDMTLSCRGHMEVWSIDDGDAVSGYETTVVVTDNGLSRVEKYLVGGSNYDYISRQP